MNKSEAQELLIGALVRATSTFRGSGPQKDIVPDENMARTYLEMKRIRVSPTNGDVEIHPADGTHKPTFPADVVAGYAVYLSQTHQLVDPVGKPLPELYTNMKNLTSDPTDPNKANPHAWHHVFHAAIGDKGNLEEYVATHFGVRETRSASPISEEKLVDYLTRLVGVENGEITSPIDLQGVVNAVNRAQEGRNVVTSEQVGHALATMYTNVSYKDGQLHVDRTSSHFAHSSGVQPQPQFTIEKPTVLFPSLLSNLPAELPSSHRKSRRPGDRTLLGRPDVKSVTKPEPVPLPESEVSSTLSQLQPPKLKQPYVPPAVQNSKPKSITLSDAIAADDVVPTLDRLLSARGVKSSGGIIRDRIIVLEDLAKSLISTAYRVGKTSSGERYVIEKEDFSLVRREEFLARAKAYLQEKGHSLREEDGTYVPELESRLNEAESNARRLENDARAARSDYASSVKDLGSTKDVLQRTITELKEAQTQLASLSVPAEPVPLPETVSALAAQQLFDDAGIQWPLALGCLTQSGIVLHEGHLYHSDQKRSSEGVVYFDLGRVHEDDLNAIIGTVVQNGQTKVIPVFQELASPLDLVKKAFDERDAQKKYDEAVAKYETQVVGLQEALSGKETTIRKLYAERKTIQPQAARVPDLEKQVIDLTQVAEKQRDIMKKQKTKIRQTQGGKALLYAVGGVAVAAIFTVIGGRMIDDYKQGQLNASVVGESAALIQHYESDRRDSAERILKLENRNGTLEKSLRETTKGLAEYTQGVEEAGVIVNGLKADILEKDRNLRKLRTQLATFEGTDAARAKLVLKVEKLEAALEKQKTLYVEQGTQLETTQNLHKACIGDYDTLRIERESLATRVTGLGKTLGQKDDELADQRALLDSTIRDWTQKYQLLEGGVKALEQRLAEEAAAKRELRLQADEELRKVQEQTAADRAELQRLRAYEAETQAKRRIGQRGGVLPLHLQRKTGGK
ncbi:hypothetical protein COV17_03965 [Candidatus Woesearchaeota archaeon CG10_big_fil_rev_8_21_14_0_10_36_11]|nr:MAG: hypothetical protein COV17_03965 [Candidatus Woesearchaeota archaeon CG10_big_fil_rev_8_21_14_0_10_36_11]